MRKVHSIVWSRLCYTCLSTQLPTMTVKRINAGQRGFFSVSTAGIISNNAITRNLFTIGLLFTTSVFQRTTAMPSRLTTRSTNERDGFVFPGTEYPWWSIKNEDKSIKREASDEKNDVEPAVRFVFPTDEPESEPQIFTPGPPPDCRRKTYCEDTDSYPVNYVKNVIQVQDDLKFLAGVDEVDGISQRIGDDSTALCQSEEQLIFPTAAQNKENKWLFILNDEKFKQGVRIETCVSPDGECAVIDGFIEGYKTICKQKYILRQLAALTANGTAIREMFRLPSSCCCHIKFEGNYSRMGISSRSESNNQTPVLNTRRRRESSVNY